MTRRSIGAGALVFGLTLLSGSWASAQWGYPMGYGGFGWGGWGGETVQGSIARGMGVYAAGAGFYNQQTAIANSINTDTVMRWNQYVYESQMNANRTYHARMAQNRLNNSNAHDEIRRRLRDTPDLRDIQQGDALNVALDEINDPRVYTKALEGAKAQIGGQTIRNIPFRSASAAVTVSIHQLVQGGPPKSLQTPEFESDRQTIKALGQQVRQQLEEGNEPDSATIDKLLTAIHAAEMKADAKLSRNTRERNEADRYLKALHGLVAMLRTPALDLILAGVEKRPEANLGELLTFMNSFNLRFGPATTPQQRSVYNSLYPKLVELRNQIAPALAAAAPAPATGSEPGEFFSGMSYEDLKKKAPAPTPPAPGAPK